MISKNANYRPDIDGLRALAVMLVLLFHFELGVKGGFVGVDVFFVISGYLITSVIRRSIKTGAFSFYDFYVGRLLRLHPALLATVGISLFLGFLLMDPSSLKSLASSSGQSLLSISNFYFWLNQGYFDAASKTQAMLHTWSLSTEWQFYLVWPFIIWGAIKISDRTFIAILLLLIAASVTASQ
ncbi:acyltransferase family protein, partial [Pseudomonas grimontii]|uniref:acyltransferase family protein n=1 Tax=Pseudomonas grimontii TaxID=129847 RepID=UPI00387B4FFE